MESLISRNAELRTSGLQDGRDDGINEASEQPITPIVSNTAILDPGSGEPHNKPDRTGRLTNLDFNGHTNSTLTTPMQDDPSPNSEVMDIGLVPRQEQAQEDGVSPTGDTGPRDLPQGGDPWQHVGDSTNLEAGLIHVKRANMYPFMEDFPNGEWWTRLDDDDGLSRSLDFGLDGFTASLNSGHEILQVTAPGTRFGIVYARGSYSDSPNAIVARAQRSVGGKSTFGLKWLGGNSHTYWRGRTVYHGLLNFRWPYKRYTLMCPGTVVGSMSTLTFVKDEMIYQILRFDPGPPLPPPVPPPPGYWNSGSDRLASRAPPPPPPPYLPKPWPPTKSGLPPKPWDYNVEIKTGGVIKLTPGYDMGIGRAYAFHWKDKIMSYYEDTLGSRHVPHEVLRLNFELFINGQKEELNLEPRPLKNEVGEIDLAVEKAINLEPGKPTIVVTAMSLTSLKT